MEHSNNASDDPMRQLAEPLLLLAEAPDSRLTTTGNGDELTTSSRRNSSVVVNRNIPLTLWYQFLRCGGEAIWLTSVLSAYVYLLRPDKPELVGYLSAVEGITQFAAACLAGVLADKYQRDLLLKVASWIGFTAALLIVLSCTFSVLPFLVVALSLNGAFDGIGLTASMALFADSMADGERSKYFTQRTLCTTSGQVVGSLAGLALFYSLHGNQWSVEACAHVMILAQIILLPSFGLLWFFRDVEQPSNTSTDNNNDENGNDDGPTCAEEVAAVSNTAGGEEEEEEENQSTTRPLISTNELNIVEGENESDDNSNSSSSSNHHDRDTTIRCCIYCSKSRWIAICTSISDVLCSVANGVSSRYFAIFFLTHLRFGPVLVQLLDALSCVMGGCLLVAAQRLSLRFGRSPVSVVFKVVGVGFLLAMVFCYYQVKQPEGDDDEDYYIENDNVAATSSTAANHNNNNNNKWWIFLCMPLYLLQNAFLNSTGALTRSLIMDNVPSGERAKWSALESINIFGWCGSAALGGMVVKHFDGAIVPVFYVTAILQGIGALPLMALFGVETKERSPTARLE